MIAHLVHRSAALLAAIALALTGVATLWAAPAGARRSPCAGAGRAHLHRRAGTCARARQRTSPRRRRALGRRAGRAGAEAHARGPTAPANMPAAARLAPLCDNSESATPGDAGLPTCADGSTPECAEGTAATRAGDGAVLSCSLVPEADESCSGSGCGETDEAEEPTATTACTGRGDATAFDCSGAGVTAAEADS